MPAPRPLTWLFVVLLATAFTGFMAGCPSTGGDDDDNDTGDDDTGDDDTGDDDTGDDDTGDDDTGDDDVDSPYGYMIEVALSATGGMDGGAATTSYDHIMIDQNQNPLCTISLEFEADYAYGPGQGDEYYQFIDQTITWTSGSEVANDCPVDWAIYEGDPVEAFLWYMHPMAFVSCEVIGQVKNLRNTFLGEDDSDYIPTGTGDEIAGTFDDYCANVGPAYQGAAGSGPMEGVWLMPGLSGQLDGLGDFGYFEAVAPGSPDYDSWMLLGLLMADSANTNEPTNGLNGDYLTIPFWLWVYQA